MCGGGGGGGDGGAVSFLGNYRPFLATTISFHFAWLFYTIASVICDSETVRF